MKSVILIAHNYSTKSLSVMSYSLAHYFTERGNKVIFISYRPYYYKPQLNTINGGELLILSWPTYARPTRINDFIWFAKIYYKHRPTIIIGHFVGSIISILVSKILSLGRAETYCYYHTLSTQLNEYNKDKNILYYIKYLRKKIFYKYFCTKILATSNKANKDFRNYYGATNSTSHLTPISDRFNATIIKRGGNIVVGFLGRLHESKGLMPLISAFEKYWKLYPEKDIILKISGSGSLKNQVIKLSKQYTNCKYLGELEYDEIDTFIQSATAMIIPSISDNLVTVGIETLMHQKPLIISSNTGLSEYLSPDYDCIEIDSTFESIFNIICQISNHQINLRKISENGRKTYLKNFTIKDYCHQMATIISIDT